MSRGAVWLSGGTGLLGSQLVPKLVADGWTLRRLSRRDSPATPAIENVRWEGLKVDTDSLRGTRAVIHLAGEPVFGGLPTAARRKRIFASRVESTRSLVGALTELPEPERPSVLLCASAIGYYGERGDEELSEDAAPGEGFLADLCRAWEEQAARVEELGMRRISLRF
ncbi:MAG: NAD-dependent epimerase/dehydratase family protein, partial [Deltaproteobacteria bacterium]|nr:NAD-dependent epimerase/dehydratase family protein [Deltaproteobacteria bacterium]